MSEVAAIGGLAIGVGGTVTSLIDSHYNRKATRRANEQDREFAMNMYNKQYHDNLAMWERENAYNSPEQQMNRLRQAGLNPHLIYGKGADNTASAIRSTSPQTTKSTPVHHDNAAAFASSANGLAQYMALKQGQASTDNLNEQVNLTRAQKLLTDANTAKIITENLHGKFDMGVKNEVRDLIVDKFRLDNQATDEGINKTAHENYRISHEVSKIKSELEQIKANTHRTRQESELLELDLELQREGVHRNSPYYIKLFTKKLEQLKQYTK